MPVYRYKFEDGVEIDVGQPIDSDPFEYLTHPDLLHAMPVKRVPQAVVANFKGSGWARK